jgi:hypothetical protein
MSLSKHALIVGLISGAAFVAPPAMSAKVMNIIWEELPPLPPSDRPDKRSSRASRVLSPECMPTR